MAVLMIAPTADELGPIIPLDFSTPVYLSNLQDRAIGAASFLLSAADVLGLPIVANAKSAIITIEPAAGAATESILARFWQDGNSPTITEGLPLMAYGMLEIRGADTLSKFRIVSADGLAHRIHVQYFNYADKSNLYNLGH